ncbi:MAG: acyltransferase family protein [Planctomycetota bacterium]
MSREHRSAGDRWNDLDAARSILMMLGVVLHAANLYAEPQDWLVGDPPGRRAFALLSGGIHVFRIPAFFVIAGFFAGFSLERYGAAEFLRRRLRRLVVPLVSAAVLLSTVQSWILYRHGTTGYGPAGGGDLGLVPFLGSPWFRDGLAEGAWVTHLWFLVHLIVYVVATWVVALAIPRLQRAARGTGAGGRVARSGFFLLALPLTAVAVDATAKYVPHAYDRILGVTSLQQLLDDLPYYVFGVVAYRARSLFEGLRAPGAWVVPALALSIAAERLLPDEPRGLTQNVVAVYVDDLTVWLSIAVVLAGFRAIASRPSRVFTYLSEASYTVYLFHHLCVIALGLALVGTGLGPLAKFGLVVSMTLAATLALHHFVVLRVPWIRLAFNGRWGIPVRSAVEGDEASPPSAR